MIWPFTKKEKSESDVQYELRQARALHNIRYPFLARTGVIREAQTLIEKLKSNRSMRTSGKGKAYWDSVMEIINEHVRETTPPGQVYFVETAGNLCECGRTVLIQEYIGPNGKLYIGECPCGNIFRTPPEIS